MSDDFGQLGIALIGCGTVGGAVATILTRDADILAEKLGPKLVLRYIHDADFTNAERLGLDKKIFCSDIKKVLADDSVCVVV